MKMKSMLWNFVQTAHHIEHNLVLISNDKNSIKQSKAVEKKKLYQFIELKTFRQPKNMSVIIFSIDTTLVKHSNLCKDIYISPIKSYTWSYYIIYQNVDLHIEFELFHMTIKVLKILS